MIYSSVVEDEEASEPPKSTSNRILLKDFLSFRRNLVIIMISSFLGIALTLTLLLALPLLYNKRDNKKLAVQILENHVLIDGLDLI
jgi:hypothetical protein